MHVGESNVPPCKLGFNYSDEYSTGQRQLDHTVLLKFIGKMIFLGLLCWFLM